MRSVLALFVAVLTILSSVALASPTRASLEARARKMQETRQYRNYVDLVARDNNNKHNNGGPGRGPGRDNGNHYGNDKGNGNGNGNRPGNGNGHGNGNSNGNGNGNKPDFESDPDNCGAPFFVCPDSYNGLGQRICNYGQCKLKCPPGLEHKLNHLFPHITFCA
ncbi:hypothetical protein RHOSPDRAFT_33285 [Rhodotorula sp. JG-1b]|nr:hypothetical protein RHOSPDRAFT_33285 [Rhodotorula sp. JG-1b]